MAQHTPGPWRANSSLIEGPQMALQIASVSRPKLGHAPRSDDEARANAALIAAAPDLLAALKDAARILEAVRFSAGLGKTQIERMERAKATIAKAEGRS